MKYLHVKNFERFQHYKDRCPPWIKLYNDILSDYDFSRLQDASKLHLILIWLLASRSDNKIPADSAWIGEMIHATEPVDIEGLVSAGFLTVSGDDSGTLAPRKQSAMPETEKETEKETEGEAPRASGLGHDLQRWAASAAVPDQPAVPQIKGGDPRGRKSDPFVEPVIEGIAPGWASRLAVVWHHGKGKFGLIQEFAEHMQAVVEASVRLGKGEEGAVKAITAAIKDAKWRARERPQEFRFLTPKVVGENAAFWVEHATRDIAREYNGVFEDEKQALTLTPRSA